MKKAPPLLALLLLVPAPSVGVLAGMILCPNTTLGTVVFALSKLWLFALPVVWCLCVDRARLSLSPLKRGGLLAGVVSGALIAAFMLGVFLAFGSRFIDRGMLVQRLTAIGLGSPRVYMAGAAYWILVNSVLEEYVWRWFCVEKCRALMRPLPAILCSAAFFTLHHALALQVYFGTAAVIVCSLGVFLGGAIWSAMYVRYRSIWPGYVSHAIVDLAVFGIGAWMLFG